MSEVIGIKAENVIYDMQSAEELGIDGEPIYFDNSEESLSIMRHTCAHLMAEALKADAFITKSNPIEIEQALKRLLKS